MSPALERPERHIFFAELADMAMRAGDHAIAHALRSEPVVLAVLQAQELWLAGGGEPLEPTRAAPSREEAITEPVGPLEGVCTACGVRGTAK